MVEQVKLRAQFFLWRGKLLLREEKPICKSLQVRYGSQGHIKQLLVTLGNYMILTSRYGGSISRLLKIVWIGWYPVDNCVRTGRRRLDEPHYQWEDAVLSCLVHIGSKIRYTLLIIVMSCLFSNGRAHKLTSSVKSHFITHKHISVNSQ